MGRNCFVDEVTVQVRSGDGGAGCVAFRREKYVPFGGPNGGDGGRGGDVVVQVNTQFGTLLDYRFRPRQYAAAGQAGMGSQCTGKDGAACVLPVPQGTVVLHAETGEVLADLDGPDSCLLLARGGRGGKGNEFFKNSVRQAPNFAQPGEPGVALAVRLELKLLADVGLVGLPNVGKSSLIASISAARPKIADYPFTTLVPNLGMVRFGDKQDFVVADVPGLVVGAHQGTGLGCQFLRHLERVRCLVHMLTARADGDATLATPLQAFAAIEREIALHKAQLAALPRIVVLNQIDLPEVAAQVPCLQAFCAARQLPFFAISAATQAGVPALVRYLGYMVSQARQAAQQAVPQQPLATPLATPDPARHTLEQYLLD